MAVDDSLNRLEQILGPGGVRRRIAMPEGPVARLDRILVEGAPKLSTPVQVYEEPTLGDKIKGRAAQGAAKFFTSNLNPLNLLSLPMRTIASTARETLDIFDQSPDKDASFGDLFKQTFDTSYGWGSVFPMKGWKGRINGFALDVLLDPLTYATFGMTVVAKGVAEGVGAAARASARSIARAAAKDVIAESARTLGRAEARALARQAYKTAFDDAVKNFATRGGRGALGKTVSGREGRQILAQHVDDLLAQSGKSVAARNEVVQAVAARGKSALYETAEGMDILNRLGVAGPGIYYFGSRVKVPGSDLVGKMLEKGVTSTRLGVSRSRPGAALLRKFAPEGTGRLPMFGPETIGEIRASLQVGKTINVGGRKIEPVLGLKLLEWDDLRRIGVAEATENWDRAATALVKSIDDWEAANGLPVHLFFDGRDYIRAGFNNPQRLAQIEAVNPGATARLESLYSEYKRFLNEVKNQIDVESIGTGRVIGDIGDGYVPRMLTPEAQEWFTKNAVGEFEEMAPVRYAQSLQSRTLKPGEVWFGHVLTDEDLTIDRLNDLASRPTREWMEASTKRGATPPPKIFRDDTPGIFVSYVRAMAEQVGTFRMAKAMMEDPEYGRALDSLVPDPDGVRRVAQEATEAAARYQSALGGYMTSVGTVRVALERSFDAVAARVTETVADDAGTRSTLHLVAAQIENGDVSAEVVAEIMDATDRAVAEVAAQAESLDTARRGFEPMLHNDQGALEGNYVQVAEQVDALRSDVQSIIELQRQARALPDSPAKNKVLSELLVRLEQHSEAVSTFQRDMNRWAAVEDVVPRIDRIEDLSPESFYALVLRRTRSKIVDDPNKALSPFSYRQSKRRDFLKMRSRAVRNERTGVSAMKPLNKPGDLSTEAWSALGSHYGSFGKEVLQSVRSVRTYERARFYLSSALQRINAGEQLTAQQTAKLRDAMHFIVYKYSQSELYRAADEAVARTMKTLYDDFVYAEFVNRYGSRVLLPSPELNGGHTKLLARTLNTLREGAVGPGGALDKDMLYGLQDMLHYAASTEQLWEISTALSDMGIVVGDDVISQILLHNSDDYVLDALRANDIERLNRLRPPVAEDGTVAVPYGRISGRQDIFGATFAAEEPVTIETLNALRAGATKPKKVATRANWPAGAYEIERVFLSRRAVAERQIDEALKTISAIDAEVRGYGHSRSAVRVRMAETSGNLVESLRKIFKRTTSELNNDSRYGHRYLAAPMHSALVASGMDSVEASSYVDNWWSQNGPVVDSLMGIYMRLRNAKMGEVVAYSDDEYATLNYLVYGLGFDPAKTGEFVDADAIGASLTVMIRGAFDDAAAVIDSEYDLLVGPQQIAYLDALSRLEQANLGLERLRVNPNAEFYFDDFGDAVDAFAVSGGAPARRGTTGVPRSRADEIELEIAALTDSDRYVAAKSAENRFQASLELAKVEIPEGQTFLGFNSEQLTDYLGGVSRAPDAEGVLRRLDFPKWVYDDAQNPEINPGGTLQSYVRLQTEAWLAAGNIASPEAVAERVSVLTKAWESGGSSRYLAKIMELRAEKFAAASDDLTFIDKIDLLRKMLDRQDYFRRKHFQSHRERVFAGYRQIAESSEKLGTQAGIDDAARSELLRAIDDADLEAGMAKEVKNALEYELREIGAFRVEDISVPSVEQQLFEKSAQTIGRAMVRDAEEIDAGYQFIRLSTIESDASASEVLTYIDRVVETARKMKSIGADQPRVVKDQRGWSSFTRGLQRRADEIKSAFPQAASSHRAGSVRLHAGELAYGKTTPIRRAYDVPVEIGMPGPEGRRARLAMKAFAKEMLDNRAKVNEFVVGNFEDPTSSEVHGWFVRLLQPEGTGYDRIGFRLISVDEMTGEAVFRNFDMEVDEIVDVTDVVDTAAGPSGALARSVPEEAAATKVRGGPMDDVILAEEVDLTPVSARTTVRVERSRLDPNAPRPAGVVPARTNIDDPDVLRAYLGIDPQPPAPFAAVVPEMTPQEAAGLNRALELAYKENVEVVYPGDAVPMPANAQVAAFDQAEAVVSPTIVGDAKKVQRAKERLKMLIDEMPEEASDGWRNGFTDFVNRATIWLDQFGAGDELEPGLRSIIAAHIESEMAFLEAAQKLGEKETDRRMFRGLLALLDASEGKRLPDDVRELVEANMAEEFGRGWEQLHKEFYPNVVVSEQLKSLWQSADFRRDPEWMNGNFAQTVKELTKFHKAYAVLTPGFHIRNSIGNAFTLYFAGSNMRNTARGIKLYRMIQRHLKTGASIETFLRTLGEEERAIVITAREAMFASGGGIFSATYREAEEGGKFAKFYTNALTRKNYEIGQAADNAVRFALAFDVVSRGGDRSSAQVAIKRFFFDYEDLSKADRYIREVIPFWLWSSRNFVSQIQNIFLNPKRYLMYSNIRRNFRQDEELETEKRLPFVAELGGFELPVSKQYYFVPDLGVMRAIQMPKEYGSYRVVSAMTPWLRIPTEMLMNRRAYTDKPVYTDGNPLAGLAAYLGTSVFPPLNQATRTGVIPGGKDIDWNAISSLLGSPIRKYGE